MSAYRYTLHRDLGQLGHIGRLAWVMLNPSTADAERDDPTIRKVTGFTLRAGYGELQVVNLFPLRATKPDDLFAAGAAMLGDVEAADAAIREACLWSSSVVIAWGRNGDRCPDRVAQVQAIIAATGRPVLALGRTQGLQPQHPLMVPYAAGLRPWTEIVGEVPRG